MAAKRVLIVVDTFGWAWHRIAEGIKRYATEGYEVTIANYKAFTPISQDHRRLKSFDAVLHCSWSECPFPYGVKNYWTLLADHGCEEEFVPHSIKWRSAIASVANNRETARVKLPKFDGIIVTNERLAESSRDKFGVEPVYLPAGVDAEFFEPAERRKPANRLTIGWCGRVHKHKRGPKGFHEILTPLKARFPALSWEVNSRTANDPLSPAQMAAWYRGLDLFVCTSMAEGSPLTPFESAACGVPTLGTNVGALPALLAEPPLSGWLVDGWDDERSARRAVDEMTTIIESLRKAPEVIEAAGENARTRIEEQFAWKILAPKWLQAMCS